MNSTIGHKKALHLTVNMLLLSGLRLVGMCSWSLDGSN